MTEFLPKFHGALQKNPVFSTLPFGFVLWGVEKVMDNDFFCPCKPLLNLGLMLLITFAPAALAFTAMLFILRPCKRSCGRCSSGTTFLKTLFVCLIPSCLWMFLLLLDGQYMACALANWEGKYVPDQDSTEKWCMPTNGTMAEKKAEYQTNVNLSKDVGLALMLAFCVFTILVLTCWDCHHQTDSDS